MPLPKGFSGPLPLFPLPNIVFFPRTLLPLHVFEARYRAMVADALAGDRLVAMALLKPGWEADYAGAPPIFDVLGVGRILQERKLDDGRYHILLHGVARARVREEVPGAPYRRAKVQVLRDREPEPSPEVETFRLGLLAVYSSLLKAADRKVPLKVETDLPVGALCDLLASLLDVDPKEKQALLEELDVGDRARRTLDLLRRSPLAGKPVLSALRERRRWPPEPSRN